MSSLGVAIAAKLMKTCPNVDRNFCCLNACNSMHFTGLDCSQRKIKKTQNLSWLLIPGFEESSHLWSHESPAGIDVVAAAADHSGQFYSY